MRSEGVLCAAAERGQPAGAQGAGALHVLLGERLLPGNRGRRWRQALGPAQAQELPEPGRGEYIYPTWPYQWSCIEGATKAAAQQPHLWLHGCGKACACPVLQAQKCNFTVPARSHPADCFCCGLRDVLCQTHMLLYCGHGHMP